MIDPQLIKRTQEFLFSSREEMEQAGISASQRDRILRLREMYLYWLEHPTYPDKAIVTELRHRHNIGVTQSYDDVRLVKMCIGNVNQVTKDYLRWKFMSHCDEAFAMARASGDANAYARTLAAMVKGTGIDKDDTKRADYSQIVPQTFEITDDPSVVGAKRIPNLENKIATMLKKYAIEVEPIEIKNE